jgi:hypothetical protein
VNESGILDDGWKHGVEEFMKTEYRCLGGVDPPGRCSMRRAR